VKSFISSVLLINSHKTILVWIPVRDGATIRGFLLKFKVVTFLACVLALFSAVKNSNAQDNQQRIPIGTTLHFCGDGAGWPPYTFFEHKNGVKTKKIIGYDLDVVQKILSPLGLKSKFSMPPWGRCILLTKQGKTYQVALSSSFSKEREKSYLMSDYYYHTTVNYFYEKSRFKSPPMIQTVSDLFKHGNVCGLHGYNYEGTGVFRNNQINRGAKNLKSVIQRTLTGRCAFFLFRAEIFSGFKLLGEKSIQFDNVKFRAVPGAKIDKFYMLISRNYKYSKALHKIINSGIERLHSAGELDKILNSYIGK